MALVDSVTFKKSLVHFLKGTEDRFRFIDSYRSEYSVQEIAHVLADTGKACFLADYALPSLPDWH